MYRNILKKDIKRKKTMNIILLLFTILATVFVASGISNVINVVNGTEYFLDKAGIGDYVVITQDKNSNVKEIIEKSEDIESYRSEECIWTATKGRKVERAKALMKKLDISEIADNDINEVSGGQLQRACICRSMINNPCVLFADEPTGALNRNTSREVMDEIVRLNDSGTTVMMATHDAGIAAKCKRVFYLVDGTIKGEYITDDNLTQTERERSLNNWLMDLGW